MQTVLVSVPVALVDVVDDLSGLFGRVVDRAGARGLEAEVHEGLKEVDRAFMSACVRQKAREAVESDTQEVVCPHCGQWAELLNPQAKRHVVTLRGRVDYRRPVYQCSQRECRKQRAPFDEELGLGPKEHFSPLVQQKAAWAGGTMTSYGLAAKDMLRQAEIPVSEKQIHRITERTAQRALELQEEEVRHFGRPAVADQAVEVKERPETLVLELDGTCAMGRDGVGHDVKVATVFGLDARAKTGSPGKERPLLLRRAYCGTSRGIQPFRAMVWALCVMWGIRSARRLVVLGDGADWIWNFSRERFHFTLADGTVEAPIEILDYYHATENLAKGRDAIFGDPEGKPAKEWYERWREAIWEGRVAELIEELEARSKRGASPAKRDELRVRAQYFRTHAGRMHYPEYRAMDLPIGSGAIEGTCKNLVKGRMACVGQRWGVENGIERMTALRVRIFNERYDDLWQTPADRLAA